MLAKLHIRGNLSYKMANLAPTWGQLGPKMEPRRAKMEAMLGQNGALLAMLGRLGAFFLHLKVLVG